MDIVDVRTLVGVRLLLNYPAQYYHLPIYRQKRCLTIRLASHWGQLKGMPKQKSYDDVDELLARISLSILKLRQTDPTTADELRSLVKQPELWVESLVLDAHRLRRLESLLHHTRRAANQLLKDLESRSMV